MYLSKIKSNAKINLALNITSKSNKLHKIETVVAFIDLYDQIFIRKINSKNHHISFHGNFSKNIKSNNTVSRLLKILDQKELLKQKFYVKIIKNIPQKAGLGGGSMNAANILKYLIKKNIIKINKKQILEITNLIGSDVILGMETTNTILTSKNKIKRFKNCKRLYTLIVKPSFGCSTKNYSGNLSKW